MEDWRLRGQEEYLSKAKLVRVRFKAYGEWDHLHCAFCWDKISENEGDLHTAYSTLDFRHLICEECYNDFKDSFGWEIETRLSEQLKYMSDIQFQRKSVGACAKEGSKCEFCGERMVADQKIAKPGYAGEDEQYWVCDTCFGDFKDMFGWSMLEKDSKE